VNCLPRARFVDADVTLEIRAVVARRQHLVDQAKLVALGAEPDIEPGQQCIRPFACEYRHHCGFAAGARLPSRQPHLR
jgi:hypothetical protein